MRGLRDKCKTVARISPASCAILPAACEAFPPKIDNFFALSSFDRVGQRLRRVFARPRFLFVKNDPVHVTAANADHRRAASLTLERNQTERLLHSRMNEEIGRAIVTREIGRVRAVLNPGNAAGAFPQLFKLSALRSIADHEQMKIAGASRLQQIETLEKRLGVLFVRQTSDVEKQFLMRRDANRFARAQAVLRRRIEDVDVNAKTHRPDIAHAPIAQNAPKIFGRDQRCLKTIVKIAHIAAGQIHHRLGRGPAKIFGGAAQIRFRKMRMIKTNDRNPERASGCNRFPCDLIRIARFDDVGTFAFQNFFDRAQIQQRAITRRAREQRRVNRIDARSAICDQLRFWPRNDEHMLITRRVILDVRDLLVHITLHPAAQRRIELSEIANLQEFTNCDLRFAIAQE